MFISLNWLKDFVDIPSKISPQELGLKLTMHTVEIDSVESQGEQYKNVVVGEILEVQPHPNADKLQLAKVDAGQAEKLEIVCGAPNIKPGQKVPVALVGAVLPGGFEIKETEIRGVRSRGMLCSEDELGLGEDHAGILILDKNAPAGKGVAEVLGLDDVVFEVDNKSITNRPDLWGHVGLARDISVFLGTKFKKPRIPEIREGKEKIKCSVKDPRKCRRYTAAAMSGIKTADSPDWMRRRLIAAGLRPINNIVDVTNYVMLETGQPMHAFDASLADEINVRPARPGEMIRTLDGEERELDAKMAVIADSDKPIAVAGVMGGANSEVGSETSDIILESANFDPVSVRKTSQVLGVRSESSKRFEKSLDPEMCLEALGRAVELIEKICPGAHVKSAVVDIYKRKAAKTTIGLDLNWLESFIGARIPEKKIKNILESLGFGVSAKEKSLWRVEVPSWRGTKDISLPEDLAEEISRIIGYDNLDKSLPAAQVQTGSVDIRSRAEERLRDSLSLGAALHETMNYAFVDSKFLSAAGENPDDYLSLANPIASNQTHLRQNLLFGLLSQVKSNQSRFEAVALYEIGNVFFTQSGNINKDRGSEAMLPLQKKRLGIIYAGPESLSELKGACSYLAEQAHLKLKFEPAEEACPHWTDIASSAGLVIDSRDLGSIGVVNKKIRQISGIKKDLSYAEFDFEGLLDLFAGRGLYFSEPDRFPSLKRDLAFVVNKKVLFSDLSKDILSFHEYIKKAELFDVYAGHGLPGGEKSLAFHITYGADKTLTAGEVDRIQDGLVKELGDKYQARLRDF